MTQHGRWQAVGTVVAGRDEPGQSDHWGGVISVIELAASMGDNALNGLAEFSHVQVVYGFHLAAERDDYLDVRRPRARADLPAVGVFADRGPRRPNRIGVTDCPILAVDGRWLMVRGLDAVRGTPVIDLKPVVRAFQVTDTVEPAWVAELLRVYWD